MNAARPDANAADARAAHLDSARRTLALEQTALGEARERLDGSFAQACEILLRCRSRVVLLGIGKSGHIARKIAATLSSTGTPAFFVHPSEAGHGDLGAIADQDAALALSYSGANDEILSLLPALKRRHIPLVSMTGKPDSELARASDAHVDASVKTEACPLDLAPTSSTTVALALGDAIAIALLEARGFRAEDFAHFHPGGALGRRLHRRVGELMHAGDATPTVRDSASLAEAVVEMNDKRLGCTTVVDQQGVMVGMFTDGDLRRALAEELDLRATRVGERMTRPGRRVNAEALAVSALETMRACTITALAVTDAEQRVAGVVHMHELLKDGLA